MGGSLVLAVGLGAIFFAILIVLATIGVITGEREQVTRSLAALDGIQSLPPEMRQELHRPFSERVTLPMLERFTSLGRRFTPTGQVDRIRRRLDEAGSPASWDVDRVLAFKIVGLIAGAVLGLVLPAMFGLGLLVAIGAFIVLAVLGFFAPDLTLYQIAYNRKERMRKELPDALDLLTITVEAGLAFDAALAQVARSTEGPLAEEFFRVLQEMQLGVGRSDAMRALGERTELPELKSFITAMVQADVFGIPIANVLRVQSKEMRLKRSQRAEEQAQKVPVKILFPLIFCIMPTLFIAVIGPGAITIVHSIFHK